MFRFHVAVDVYASAIVADAALTAASQLSSFCSPKQWFLFTRELIGSFSRHGTETVERREIPFHGVAAFKGVVYLPLRRIRAGAAIGDDGTRVCDDVNDADGKTEESA